MKIASRKKKMPSIANGTPKTSPKRLMNRGHRSPSSNDSTVPVTAPTAKVTAATFDHRCASTRQSSSPPRRPRQFAMSMIAGKATPRLARMMWKPSVIAIWLRAGSSCDESAALAMKAARDIGRVAP
jgi:hypothetical protein